MFPPRRSLPQIPTQGFNMQQPFGGFQQQVTNPGTGGLLKRLFSGSSQVEGIANSSNVQGMLNPSTLQSLANPANLSGMMGNVQKALKMAESVGPMVQQYGPLVKNIPSMWKIYKELNSDDDNDNDENKAEKSTGPTKTKERELPKEKEKSVEKTKPNSKPKDSVPKLYV